MKGNPETRLGRQSVWKLPPLHLPSLLQSMGGGGGCMPSSTLACSRDAPGWKQSSSHPKAHARGGRAGEDRRGRLASFRHRAKCARRSQRVAAENCLPYYHHVSPAHPLDCQRIPLHLSSFWGAGLVVRPSGRGECRLLRRRSPGSPCNCASGGAGAGDGVTVTSHYLPLGSLRLQTAMAHGWVPPLHGRM